MHSRKISQGVLVTWALVFMISCSSGTTRLIHSHLDDARVGNPISDVLIIVIADEQEVRKIFEKHFVDRFKAAGVEAVSSISDLSVEMGAKLNKQAISDAIDKHGSDTLAIAHLVGLENSEVFSRTKRRSLQYHNGYYGFYSYAWDYVNTPTVYGEHVKISIETRLYDVQTESLIWSGESQTMDPETTGQAIGQVVDVVMKDLNKNGLLPGAP